MIMSAYRSLRGPHPRTAARQAAAPLRRAAAALAALTCALLASAAIIPAASASIPITPGGPDVPPATVPVFAGGMAGWQITLIAVGAALVAAAAAVVLDRARATRRSASATIT
jgi:hypothetical protein